MTTSTARNARPRKSLDQRRDELLARLHALDKRKSHEEKRDLQRLKMRLGSAAMEAGFTADWTDAQLGRAMAAAVKAHDAPKAAAPVAPPKAPEALAAKASAPVAPVAKPAVAPAAVKP